MIVLLVITLTSLGFYAMACGWSILAVPLFAVVVYIISKDKEDKIIGAFSALCFAAFIFVVLYQVIGMVLIAIQP